MTTRLQEHEPAMSSEPPPSGGATRGPDGGLAVGVHIHNDMLVVSLCGPLDVYTVSTMYRLLMPDRQVMRAMVIDLTQVTLIDSFGFAALAKLRDSAHPATRSLFGVICPDPLLRRTFDIVGLVARVAFGRDLDDLDRAWGRRNQAERSPARLDSASPRDAARALTLAAAVTHSASRLPRNAPTTCPPAIAEAVTPHRGIAGRSSPSVRLDLTTQHPPVGVEPINRWSNNA